MGYVQGEGRTQGTLFPVCLEELIPDDHMCRVIDTFVDRLDMAGLGFERAEAAETGRPGYNPRDLLKLYLYGYLQQIRSSRRLESECRRNIELMWLLGRLAPDHKTIAEFRRMHREGVTAAGAELVRLARSVGLVKGEWIAIDGSKFQTVSSARSVREREALERYLEQLEQTDQQDEVVIDKAAVASALEKLRQHREPEAVFMRTANGVIPAYNVQAAVDAEHALIVAQQVTVQASDNRSLQPMAEAAQAALGGPTQPINVVADAGYSNGEQAEACEAKGILPHVPANRGVNNHGDGTLFDRTEFIYQPESDTFLCPAGQTLARKQLAERSRGVLQRSTRSVRNLRAQIEMHDGLPANGLPAPERRGATAHAATSHSGGYATAPLHGGASICESEIPHLRTSALPVTRTARSPDRNQPGGSCLQLEAHAEYPRREPTERRSSISLRASLRTIIE